MPHLIFFGLAIIAIAGAFLVILAPKTVYSALALIVCFVSTAGLLLQLGAQFIAFLQIIIYAGAIMILFLFVIMLLDQQSETFSPNRLVKLLVLIVPLGTFMTLLLTKNFPLPPATETNWKPIMTNDVQSIGNALFRDYLLPFEVTSILILVAILGAIVLTKRPNH